MLDAEKVVEGALKLLFADAGVALLNFREQALLGGEEDAGAVGVDGPAFEDEAVGGAVWTVHGGLEALHIVEIGDV